jgi:lipopolysaccharide transport system permease protein
MNSPAFQLSQPTDAELSALPITVYTSRSEVRHPVRLLAGMMHDFWRGRELAWRLFLRNLRGLYRQTLFGLFWVFIPPLANTSIWIFLRSAGILDTGIQDVNPTIYILTGMILWQGFIDAFRMPLDLMDKNRNMISKLNFPRESLLLVGLGEVLFDMVIRLGLLIPILWLWGSPLQLAWLMAPVAILGLILLGMSIGLILMPFDSLYQDIGRFVTVVIPFWMIITPIIYLPRMDFPGSVLNWLNPASPFLLVARDWILFGSTGHWPVALIYAGLLVPLFLLGLIVYRISIPVLVERMNAA